MDHERDALPGIAEPLAKYTIIGNIETEEGNTNDRNKHISPEDTKVNVLHSTEELIGPGWSGEEICLMKDT